MLTIRFKLETSTYTTGCQLKKSTQKLLRYTLDRTFISFANFWEVFFANMSLVTNKQPNYFRICDSLSFPKSHTSMKWKLFAVLIGLFGNFGLGRLKFHVCDFDVCNLGAKFTDGGFPATTSNLLFYFVQFWGNFLGYFFISFTIFFISFVCNIELYFFFIFTSFTH